MSAKKHAKNGKAGMKIAGGFATEVVPVDSLKPHPENYRSHPPDQLLHIKASLEQHGVYRNVVVARDLTILAGHGVVEAAKLAKLVELPVRRLNVAPDSVEAKKILVADNELGRFAEDDDDRLSELLKGIRDDDVMKLLGTGYDDVKLVALLNSIPAEPVDVTTSEDESQTSQSAGHVSVKYKCPHCAFEWTTP